jgi:hypothetical protein
MSGVLQRAVILSRSSEDRQRISPAHPFLAYRNFGTVTTGEERTKVNIASVTRVVISFSHVWQLRGFGLMKGYVQRWERRKSPDGDSNLLDYWFTANAEQAALWKTKEDADFDCALFERHAIEIRSSAGGKHICRGFMSEERGRSGFVVFCNAPFIPQDKSPIQVEKRDDE